MLPFSRKFIGIASNRYGREVLRGRLHRVRSLLRSSLSSDNLFRGSIVFRILDVGDGRKEFDEEFCGKDMVEGTKSLLTIFEIFLKILFLNVLDF